MHVAGNLVWFHTDFLLSHLPYMPKVVDKKQQIQAGVFRSDRTPRTQAEVEADKKAVAQARANREQFLTERGQTLTRYAIVWFSPQVYSVDVLLPS